MEWWYAQNTFAFVRSTRLADFPEASPKAELCPTDLVHPRAFVRLAIPSEMTPRMLKEVALLFRIFLPRLCNAFAESNTVSAKTETLEARLIPVASTGFYAQGVVIV